MPLLKMNATNFFQTFVGSPSLIFNLNETSSCGTFISGEYGQKFKQSKQGYISHEMYLKIN